MYCIGVCVVANYIKTYHCGEEFLNQKIPQFQECLVINTTTQLAKIFYHYFDFNYKTLPSLIIA